MKVIKKITAIMLSIMMVLGMSSVVSAAGTTTSGTSSTVTGKITINNAVPGQTYNIYKILDLESYDATDPDNGHYAYKAATKWDTFITRGGGEAYLTKDPTSGYVTWKNGVGATESDAAVFAKKALAYANNSSPLIAPDDTKTAPNAATGETTSTVVFDNLDLGYYLVDSTTGTICSIDTTNNEVTIKEKNGVPSVKKEVQEDSTSVWGTSNTADIGDTVNFKTTITAQAGAQNYVLHDKMSDGLTFENAVNAVTVKIQKSGTSGETLVDSSNYEVKTLGFSSGDTCTFHVEFKQAFCDDLANGDQIIIYYSAKLNDNAKIKTDENKNETWLGYGDNNFTTHETTTTYTYEIPVFKYTIETASTQKPLAKAVFKLSKESDGTETIKIKQKTGESNVYLVDSNATTTEITTDSTGRFTIQGLDAGTYYLTETKQPDGYNKLTSPITININENGQITVDGTTVTQVEVENKSGSLLPSTGGRGTTLFYILGAILVVGSGVVLITKKRMK